VIRHRFANVEILQNLSSRSNNVGGIKEK